MSIIRYLGAAEDARVVVSFSILKQWTQPRMEDRVLRGRRCYGALVAEATAVVITERYMEVNSTEDVHIVL